MMKNARLRAWIPASLFALGALVAASYARAEGGDDNQARANAIFQEARKAYIAGDYATACPKYEEVVRLRPGLGARLGLGDCYRKMGKLALAWETYRGIAEEAPVLAEKATTWADKTTAKKRGDEARGRMEEIQPKLGWLTIALAEPVAAVPGIVVQLDGATLGKERFGVKLPAERGEHVVSATAPSKKSWERSVALAEGAELTVGVQMLEDEAPAKPDPKPNVENPPKQPLGTKGLPAEMPTRPPSEGPTTKPPPDAPGHVPQYDFFSTQRIIGLGIGVAGVGALAVGSYFGLDAMEKRDQSVATGQCDGVYCDGEGYRLRQASYDAGTLSTGFFIGGGVALAGGLALFLTAPKKPRPPAAVSFVVGPSALLVNGRF